MKTKYRKPKSVVALKQKYGPEGGPVLYQNLNAPKERYRKNADGTYEWTEDFTTVATKGWKPMPGGTDVLGTTSQYPVFEENVTSNIYSGGVAGGSATASAGTTMEQERQKIYDDYYITNVSGGTGGYTNLPPTAKKVKEKTFAESLEESELSSIEKQKKYNRAKYITDSLLTADALIANRTAGRPEPIMPKPVVAPSYKTIVPQYKNAMQRSSAAAMAYAKRIADEAGRPDLIPAFLAEILSNENTGMTNIAAKQVEIDNLQSTANAEAINKTAENQYTAEVADATAMDAMNLQRSTVEADLLKSLMSTSPNTYMNNEALLEDYANQTKLFETLISSGMDKEEALAVWNAISNRAKTTSAIIR